MSEHKLDKMFREKLGGHQAAYNAASWAAAESMIEGQSSKGAGFWLLGILGILLCGAAIGGAYNFHASTKDTYAFSSQHDVLLDSRIQEMEMASNTKEDAHFGMDPLKTSTSNRNTHLLTTGTSDEKSPSQKIESRLAEVEATKVSSASANDLPPGENNEPFNVQPEPPITSSTNPGTSHIHLTSMEDSAPEKITPNIGTPRPNTSKEDSKETISSSTETIPDPEVETRTNEGKTTSSKAQSHENFNSRSIVDQEKINSPKNIDNQKSELFTMMSLPPALASYDFQSGSFNAVFASVNEYRPSYWEIKFHAGYGYNSRSLKALQEGVEGYTALRDREELVGWSPEIGFEAIYEPGRFNYSIGLNWFSIAETNNYSPITEFDTSSVSTPIFTSIETSYFGIDSVWVQEKDSGGFFGYWEVFTTEVLNEDSLILYSNESISTSEVIPVDPTNERNTFQYVEIPVSIGYEFEKGKWSLGVRTGVSAGLLISTSGQYLETDRQSAVIRQDITRRWIWNYQARIALGYALNDKTRLYLEPVFKTNINSIVNREDFSQKYSTYGLRLGLGFKF